MKHNSIFKDYAELLKHSKCHSCGGRGWIVNFLAPSKKEPSIKCSRCEGTGFIWPIAFLEGGFYGMKLKHQEITNEK